MENYTTYTVTGKLTGMIWEFNYDLNGHLRAFKIIEGELTGKQMSWLFGGSNFPGSENLMKTIWLQDKELQKHFEVTIGEPDLSFEAFYKAYNYPVSKQKTIRAWEKLSKKDKLEALKGIKPYDGMLARKHIAKAHPSTYLNSRRWEDDNNAIH